MTKSRVQGDSTMDVLAMLREPARLANPYLLYAELRQRSRVRLPTGEIVLSRNPQWSQAELEELRMIRRLQVMMNMVMSVISQDVNMTVEEASKLVADAKRAALAMFPDKELAYDLLYKPRLQRLMNERYRLQ